MRKIFMLCYCTTFLLPFVHGQTTEAPVPIIYEIDISTIESGKIHRLWLQLGTDAFNRPITVPVFLAKGIADGPVVGLTAALHGNELNGIPIIQNIFKQIDVSNLKGTLIAVPGLNPTSIFSDRRRFIDQEDLNRNFPGKESGNRSQQMAYQIDKKIISLLDFHVDMHTASFGRSNSLYARADIRNDTLMTMARLQEPDIVLNNKGKPSFGVSTAGTMRASALSKGIYSITVEYGNPQVYQQEMIRRGEKGIYRLLQWLQMIDGDFIIPETPLVCSKSYWIYTDKGGFLEVFVALKEKVKKDQRIAVLKNPFGDIIKEFHAPEAGIVIGKSTNPATMSGGRILHLGILEKTKK